MEPVRLGVIGGSGVYDMQTLTDFQSPRAFLVGRGGFFWLGRPAQ